MGTKPLGLARNSRCGFPYRGMRVRPEDVAYPGAVYLSGAGPRALASHTSMPGALKQQLEELERYNLSDTSESGPPSAASETDALLADSPAACETDRELARDH